MNIIKFIINNSLTTIQDPSDEVEDALWNNLAYLRPGAKHAKGYYDKKTKKWIMYNEINKYIRLYDTNKKSFPTGLLTEAKIIIEALGPCKITITDYRRPPQREVPLPRKLQIPLRKYQENAVDTAIYSGRGTIESATGTGKTVLIQEIIYRRRVPTLVIVPTISLLQQTTDFLTKVFGTSKVGVIGGGSKPTKFKPIVVSTIQSLIKYPQAFFDKFDQLIIDESHHASAETYRVLNETRWNHIYYRYFLTGTAFRNSGDDLGLKGVIGDKIFEYTAPAAIKDGWLCPVKFIMYPFKHGSLARTVGTNWKKENSLLIVGALKTGDDDIIYYNEYHEYVANIANAINNAPTQIPTIIFVKEIHHGLALQQRIPGSQFVTGEEKKSVNKKILKDFCDKKFNILIGTQIIGEGVDLPPAQVGIMACGGKAKSDIIQKIGRFLRPNNGKSHATIIDFIHENAMYLRVHSNKRINIYRTYQTTDEPVVIIKD